MDKDVALRGKGTPLMGKDVALTGKGTPLTGKGAALTAGQLSIRERSVVSY